MVQHSDIEEEEDSA